MLVVTALRSLGILHSGEGCAERGGRAGRELAGGPASPSVSELFWHRAAAHDWPWDIRLVPDPDKILSQADQLVATADSGILDVCDGWVNLARAVIDQKVPNARVIDFSVDPE